MSDLAQKRGFALPKIKGNAIVMALYLLFLLLPIYWLLNMSLKTNTEILNSFTLWPRDLTFDNYVTILTDASWYSGYLNSMAYVVMNMVISLAVALPAAYAFSRYSFMGDKHLFFWLLTNRMAPPAVFALPFFQLYSSVGLFDTHIAVALAHCLFNVPLAVWILEGFMRGVPKEIDETAYIDGYSFPRFFIRIFTPLVASGIVDREPDDGALRVAEFPSEPPSWPGAEGPDPEPLAPPDPSPARGYPGSLGELT